MDSIKRLKKNELASMSIVEKDKLISHLFDSIEHLESELKILEARYVTVHPLGEHKTYERRQFKRQPISNVNTSFCEILFIAPKIEFSDEYKFHYEKAIDKASRSNHHYRKDYDIRITFQLHDISMAGCSILNCEEEYSYFLRPNMIYENCRIIAQGEERVIVSFKVMSKRSIETTVDHHKFNELIGIKFIDIKHQQI